VKFVSECFFDDISFVHLGVFKPAQNGIDHGRRATNIKELIEPIAVDADKVSGNVPMGIAGHVVIREDVYEVVSQHLPEFLSEYNVLPGSVREQEFVYQFLFLISSTGVWK
jgi:hypothetical protein